MYKVLDAHEIQVNERTQGSVKTANVIHKGGKGRSQYSNKKASPSPAVVSDFMEKYAKKNGVKQRGVWNPFGKAYECNGMPDTDLMELSNDVGKRKGKKPLASKDYRDPSKSMIRLMSDMKSTQKLLKEWKFFDRSSEVKASPDKDVVKKDAFSDNGTAPRKKTTLEIIRDLGVEKKTKKKTQQLKKTEYDFANEKDPNTLVARWHQQFAKIQKQKDEELFETLFLREEDKDAVFRSKILRNNATYIVGIPTERKKSARPSRKNTRLSDGPGASAKIGSLPKRVEFQKDDTCYYFSPTGTCEIVTILGVARRGIRGGDEIEYHLQEASGRKTSAYGRFLRKHYDKLQRKRVMKNSVKEMSLWERAKLMKLKSMSIETPAFHFVNRIRKQDLFRSDLVDRQGDDMDSKAIPSFPTNFLSKEGQTKSKKRSSRRPKREQPPWIAT